MELDWSTFLLEIVNFLVLVWILKHFLYKPVINIIAQRREHIQKKEDAATALQAEAESLKNQYQTRLTKWEGEKKALHKALHKEIETERKQLMEQLSKSLEEEKKKSHILIERKAKEELINNEKAALQQGALFCSRMLSRLAGPELENAIVQITLEELDKLSVEQQQLLQTACSKETAPISISSAYHLSAANREHIEKVLHKIVGQKIRFVYKQESTLISGLRIRIGSWYLGANLKDELKYFSDSGHAID